VQAVLSAFKDLEVQIDFGPGQDPPGFKASWTFG
jgi:hypothetical protein